MPGVTTTPYRPTEDEFVLMRNPLDLKLEIIETPDALSGTVSYTLSRFATADIRRLAESMSTCLTMADADAAIRVGDLSERLLAAR